MDKGLKKVGKYNELFDLYLPYKVKSEYIYQSAGLAKHILKRHPECLKYMDLISEIISSPDYIDVNPNEKEDSFELVKILTKNIQIGIKIDAKDHYLYVATLHIITKAKLEHGIANGRLKKFDK
ncbi:MAG: hypothetical protein NC517_00995 [Firmicutes bacterium]|nr:hypothetical protein [Bacillota bacterium]